MILGGKLSSLRKLFQGDVGRGVVRSFQKDVRLLAPRQKQLLSSKHILKAWNRPQSSSLRHHQGWLEPYDHLIFMCKEPQSREGNDPQKEQMKLNKTPHQHITCSKKTSTIPEKPKILCFFPFLLPFLPFFSTSLRFNWACANLVAPAPAEGGAGQAKGETL